MESAWSPVVLLCGALVRVEIQVQFTSTCLFLVFMEQKWTGWAGSVTQDPSPSILIGKVFCCLLIEVVTGKAFRGDTWWQLVLGWSCDLL